MNAAAETAHRSPRNRGIIDELEATSRAVLAAADAHVQDAIANVHWQRCGVLQRLTRATPRRDQP